jgi:cytochrome d ubiquinol oxidase subunit I
LGKFNKWFHWFCGVVVGVSGLASGILVVAANAWMNSPAGFDYSWKIPEHRSHKSNVQ